MYAYVAALTAHSRPAQSAYAWVCDSTLVEDPADDTRLVEDTEDSRNGTTGPHNAPPELLGRLGNGEGRVWRTLFDTNWPDQPQDQRVCHVGRYLDWSDLDPAHADRVDCDAEFGPLEDLSAPDCGAVTVQYRQDDGTWKTL